MQKDDIMCLLNENQGLIVEFAELSATNIQLRHQYQIPLIDPDDINYDPNDPLKHKDWTSLVTPLIEDDTYQLMRKNTRLKEEIAKMRAANQSLRGLPIQNTKMTNGSIPIDIPDFKDHDPDDNPHRPKNAKP